MRLKGQGKGSASWCVQAEKMAEAGGEKTGYMPTLLWASVDAHMWGQAEHQGRVRILHGDQEGLGPSRVQVRGEDA